MSDSAQKPAWFRNAQIAWLKSEINQLDPLTPQETASLGFMIRIPAAAAEEPAVSFQPDSTAAQSDLDAYLQRDAAPSDQSARTFMRAITRNGPRERQREEDRLAMASRLFDMASRLIDEASDLLENFPTLDDDPGLAGSV